MLVAAPCSFFIQLLHAAPCGLRTNLGVPAEVGIRASRAGTVLHPGTAPPSPNMPTRKFCLSQFEHGGGLSRPFNRPWTLRGQLAAARQHHPTPMLRSLRKMRAENRPYIEAVPAAVVAGLDQCIPEGLGFSRRRRSRKLANSRVKALQQKSLVLVLSGSRLGSTWSRSQPARQKQEMAVLASSTLRRRHSLGQDKLRRNGTYSLARLVASARRPGPCSSRSLFVGRASLFQCNAFPVSVIYFPFSSELDSACLPQRAAEFGLSSAWDWIFMPRVLRNSL